MLPVFFLTRGIFQDDLAFGSVTRWGCNKRIDDAIGGIFGGLMKQQQKGEKSSYTKAHQKQEDISLRAFKNGDPINHVINDPIIAPINSKYISSNHDQ